MQYFEVTKQQTSLAKIGREMMDFSEYFPGLGKLKDHQLATLNTMSHVGNMLTKIGVTFGPRLKDLTAENREMIAKFVKKHGGTKADEAAGAAIKGKK